MTSSNNYLLILNSKDDIKLKLDSEKSFVYSINSGSLKNENSQSLNSYKKFHKIAFEIKEQYINLIGDLAKYFENDETFNNKNFFYFTEISCKRTEYLKNFDYICHILFLKSIINEYNINKIIFYNVPNEIITTINSFSKINFKILKKYNNSKYKIYKIFLRQTYFGLKILFLKILLLSCYSKKIISVKNYYFSTYPKNFNNENQIKYEKYYQKNSAYILSLLTDNVHQKFKIFDFFKVIKNLKKRFSHKFIISDAFIEFKDLIFFVFASVKFINIFRRNVNSIKINNTDFSDIIYSDFKKSYERLVRLLVISKSYTRLAKEIKHQSNFHYYLFEYPYGRMLSLSFAKSNINRIGFQHGPVGYLKMICFISNDDQNYMHSNQILPNNIVVEDHISQKIYQSGNFLNLKIMHEIYRLKYLKKLKRLKSIESNHLIACGLHDGLMIFKIMLNKIKMNKNINYILKLHPKASNQEIINLVNYYNFKNLTIAEQQIEYYLEYIDKVYFSYTSIGNEAAFLGIKNEVLYSNFKLNESVYCKKEKFLNSF